VIPAIERATGREVKRPMARTADLLRLDREGLDAQAVRAMREIVSGPPDDLRFDAAALRSLPRTIASRVVRLALYRILSGDDVVAWSRDAVDGVLDLAAGRPGRRRDLPNGLKARRDAEYVSVSRASPESRV
jgi:hypothetical protein